MRKLSRITALVMAFILFVTVSPMWSLNVSATEINNPDEQTQQIQQQESAQGQDVNEGQDQGDDQQQGQNDEDQGQQAGEGQGQQADEGQEQQAGEGQEQAVGQESENEQNPQNDQEQAASQENTDEQTQQAQQQEPAAGGEGGEQGEEEPLEIPQINNMQNMVLMSAPVMLGAAANPEEGEGDGTEEGEVDPDKDVHKLGFGLDGAYGMQFIARFSYDDGAEWVYPMGADWITLDDPEFNYFELALEGLTEDGKAGDLEVPATGPVLVRLDFRDPNANEDTVGRIAMVADNVVGSAAEGEEPPTLAIADIPEENQILWLFEDVEDMRRYHYVNVAFDFPNHGDRGILDESQNYLYAYSGVNGVLDPYEDLARELYCRFVSVPMYGNFGLEVGDVWIPEQAEAAERGIQQLKERVFYTGDTYSIDVQMADGSVSQRPVEIIGVNWGFDNEGKEIVGYYDVITLGDPEEIIIKTSAENPTYYSRSAFTDQVPFTSDEGDCFPAIVIFDAPIGDGALIGGNGCDVTLTGSDAGLIAVDLNTPEWMKAATGADYGTKIRFLSSGESYIAVAGSGETKAYGGLGENGVVTDKIFTTGENAEARVYIGESTVYLEPLVVGPVADGIASVELKDPSQKEGVEIDASNLDKVKLTFKSNFYDSVPLTITYKSGKKKDITILRIGVVLSYRYLGGATDFDEGEREDFLWSDARPDDKVSFKYNYFQGQQVLVYAIYYHPSNDLTASGGDDLYLNVEYDDGHKEIIPHYAYIPENDNAVGVSWFLIGYAPAKHFDGNVWIGDITEQTYVNKYGNAGGLSMTVLNAGYNDNTTFGGTQVGAGKGVHWDGKITWY